MIRTPELSRAPGAVGHHRCGVVTADVEEPPQRFGVVANGNHGIAAAQFARYVLTGRAQLLDAASDLPRPGEHGAPLEVEDARVGVPRRGDRVRLGKGSVPPVRADDLVERPPHHRGHCIRARDAATSGAARRMPSLTVSSASRRSRRRPAPFSGYTQLPLDRRRTNPTVLWNELDSAGALSK